MKTCSSCRCQKSYSDFHKNKRQPDGLANQCKPCTSDSGRKDYQTHKRRRTSAGLFRKYGITIDDYERMEMEQDYCCALCGEPELIQDRKLAVDHDHDTGRVRGLLCFKCNTALGRVCDTESALDRLIEYIRCESCQ